MNTTEIKLPESILVKNQVKTYGPKLYTENGQKYRITAKVRFDDQCGNGHNSFSITAEIDEQRNGVWRDCCGGCCHDEVSKRFPELAPFIKWHLTITDGPMHYIANTVYHATEHGPKSAWVYFGDKESGIANQCMKYCDIAEAEKICKKPGFSMEVDIKTAKVANLDYARSTAVWPDATQEQLLDSEALKERLPALMEEFKRDVESLGFVY